ncbi:hydroxymethylglutaryl-coenzyme A synthase N terminal-domain-containing protein [Schizophyllum commune]
MTVSTLEQDFFRPKDVGILAIDVYFPYRCVSEAELEEYDGASKGKYTIGLGQEYMAFTDDREDINSFALNAVAGLLEKYSIDPTSIGRLEVGTETIIDKSKSVKTTLMDLFAEAGNFDIEGVDSKNACYGSTAALFNAINWIESASWDGRNAIVVAADIAVYAAGPARPAGGAGAVAMLIGPDAPVVFEPVHGTYMSNLYDFYKPNLASREKIAKVFKQLDGKVMSSAAAASSAFALADVDYALFHSPFGKQAVKGHARMLFIDFLANPTDPQFADIPSAHDFRVLDYEASLRDKNLERTFVAASEASFAKKTDPSMACSRRLGNMYTASLYGCLASLIACVSPADLLGKPISMYAFGGGCAASFFTARVNGDTSLIREKMDLIDRLSRMKVVPPQEFVDALQLREKNHNVQDLTPEGSVNNIWPGAYYLDKVDDKYRRKYARRPLAGQAVLC